jgi:hypothetical protein
LSSSGFSSGVIITGLSDFSIFFTGFVSSFFGIKVIIVFAVGHFHKIFSCKSKESFQEIKVGL